MRRRVAIIAVSGILSLIIMVASMEMVCIFLNAMFPHHHPKYHVIWLVK